MDEILHLIAFPAFDLCLLFLVFFSYTHGLSCLTSILSLTLTMPNFLYGIIFLHFWHNPLSFLGITRWELEHGQPTVQSLVRLHGCAGWPGSILATKTNHF